MGATGIQMMVGTGPGWGNAGPQGATGSAGPTIPNFQKSFPGPDLSVISETRLADGSSLVIKANSTMYLETSVRIQADVRAFLKEGDTEVFVAQMSNWEIYERRSGIPQFQSMIGEALERRKIPVPDGLVELARAAAKAAMKMSSVLMAAIHLEFLREEDFTEAWRAAHVLEVMDT